MRQQKAQGAGSCGFSLEPCESGEDVIETEFVCTESDLGFHEKRVVWGRKRQGFRKSWLLKVGFYENNGVSTKGEQWVDRFSLKRHLPCKSISRFVRKSNLTWLPRNLVKILTQHGDEDAPKAPSSRVSFRLVSRAEDVVESSPLPPLGRVKITKSAVAG